MKLRWVLPALVCCLLLAGCSRQAEIRELEFVLAELPLCDGTTVDLWREDGWEDGDCYYRLSDGTDLLRVKLPMGPENVHNTYENVEDLNETARAAVLAWFENRGLLYDTERELERAYGRYLACQENREEYADRFVQQIIYPAGSNEAIICFVTEVTLPLEEPQKVEMITLQTVFDRETGQVISGWDLFTIPEAEVRAWVAEHAAGDDPVLRREMETALEPEWIYLFSEGLSVDFPLGSLPSQETAYGWFEEYEKAPGLCSSPGPFWTARRRPEKRAAF